MADDGIFSQELYSQELFSQDIYRQEFYRFYEKRLKELKELRGYDGIFKVDKSKEFWESKPDDKEPEVNEFGEVSP